LETNEHSVKQDSVLFHVTSASQVFTMYSTTC